MLADDEDRWLLSREVRTVHALVLLKTLQFSWPPKGGMAADGAGWISPWFWRLRAPHGRLLGPSGEDGTSPRRTVRSATYKERGERRRHEALGLATVTCGVACGGFDG